MRLNRRHVEMAAHPMWVIARQNDRFTGTERNRRGVLDFDGEMTIQHVMVENNIIDFRQQRPAILRLRLRKDAPGFGELRLQENTADQAHNAQYIR